MPSLLITAFGPWGTHQSNSSGQWWTQAAVTPPIGWDLHYLELPVDWIEAPSLLFQKMESLEDLSAIVLCGLAENRATITPERFAHNLAAHHTPDVSGAFFPSETIIPGGPLALASTLPLGDLMRQFSEAGILAIESRDAGTFLCNFLNYQLLHRIQSTPAIRGGFIHVPPRSYLTDAQWQRAAEIVVAVVTGAEAG